MQTSEPETKGPDAEASRISTLAADSQPFRLPAWQTGLIWVCVLAGLYLTQYKSYLLFHSIIEIFSVVVAASIWLIAWNTRQYHQNEYMSFVGIAYFFVGFLDLLHTLAYKGMGVFPGANSNLPTQLWIMARYLESLSLMIAPAFLGRGLDHQRWFAAYLLLTLAALSTLFVWPVFPDCFITGSGLTAFKKISEYIISAILALAIYFLWQKRAEFEERVLSWLIASIILTIGAELAFTFYISVYGLSNMIGHYLKLISFYLIYKALVETGLVNPIQLLFRSLKKKERDQAELIGKLQESLAQVKQLSGLLPICSGCKKIRNDEGYWQQLEIYIDKHSEAEFSHCLCPQCAKELYPEHFNRE